MEIYKKISLTILVTFLAFGIFILFYLFRHGEYPLDKVKLDLFVSFLIGLNTAFIIPIIQTKVDKWAS